MSGSSEEDAAPLSASWEACRPQLISRRAAGWAGGPARSPVSLDPLPAPRLEPSALPVSGRSLFQGISRCWRIATGGRRSAGGQGAWRLVPGAVVVSGGRFETDDEQLKADDLLEVQHKVLHNNREFVLQLVEALR